MALRNEEARVVFLEHRADFEDQMVSVIADVLDRLARVPEVPIKQLTATVLRSAADGPLSREVDRQRHSGGATRSDDQAATGWDSTTGEASHVCGAPHQQVKCATTPRLVSS